MDIQLTTPQVIGLVIAWFVLGAAFDFFKILLTFGGKYISFIPKVIKDSSRASKNNLSGDRDVKAQVVKDFIDAVKSTFSDIKRSFLAWSMNFLRQVVKPETENRDDVDIQINETVENQSVGTDEDFSVFDNRPENKNAGQKVVGALIEFIALLAFLQIAAH